MSDRNMTEIVVDGFRYKLSIAAKGHIFEVLEPYQSTREEMEAPKVVEPVERTIVSPTPEKKPIFGKKDKKKK